MNFSFEVLADVHAIVSLGILLHTVSENKSIYGISPCYFVMQVISGLPKLLLISLLTRNWGQYNIIRDAVFLIGTFY
jgi:hypothetical protein